MTGAHVKIDNLCKTYTLGDGSLLDAAKNLSIEIPAGSFTAVTGPSGSGKSTLLHLIGAIDTADSGTISVDDTDVTQLRGNAMADYRASIGFIFQQFHLLPSMTILDNVLAPLVGRKTTFDRRQRATQLLAEVGLEHRQDALPNRLSGGQQQRVAIARALISSPGLLLADEPTGNLDSTTASDILALLARLRADHGTTIVMATHDPSIAAIADGVIAMRDGVVVSC